MARSLSSKIISVAVDKLVAAGGVHEITRLGEKGHSYALVGTLSDDSDAHAERIEISLTGGDSNDALAVPPRSGSAGFSGGARRGPLKNLVVTRRATLEHPISQMCTSHQMAEPIYADWCGRFGNQPVRHRKQWEFVFILRALEYYGALRPDARGLGFGVGIEPLSSLFAAEGCRVMATDLAADDDRALAGLERVRTSLAPICRAIHKPYLCGERGIFTNAFPIARRT